MGSQMARELSLVVSLVRYNIAYSWLVGSDMAATGITPGAIGYQFARELSLFNQLYHSFLLFSW
jgi:hypothetical protein